MPQLWQLCCPALQQNVMRNIPLAISIVAEIVIEGEAAAALAAVLPQLPVLQQVDLIPNYTMED